MFGLNDESEEQVENNDLLEPVIVSDNKKQPEVSQETLDTIAKIEKSLPQVRGLEASDDEMDELSNMAKDTFNTLIDLGMQVDSRFSAEIFNSASSMLGHAITAKTAKVNKKLKMIDLQLKKAELERKISATKKINDDETPTDLGTGKVLDRTEIIKMFMEENNNLSDVDKKIKKDK